MSNGLGILRRFNDAGIAEFVRRIETLRAGGAAEIGDAFVTDEKLTEPIVPEVQLERPSFKTKRDAGEYLSERTRAARAAYGDDDRGLWTWLSAWHWDAVCPIRENGNRKVLGPYHYAYGFGNKQRRGQHLLAIATMFYEIDPQSRLTLETPVFSLTQAVKEVSTRLALLRIGGLLALLDILYWDKSTGRIKPGLVDSRATKPGDLANRLPARIRQLEVTHDLTNLTAEQLLNLLGDEFRQWAVAPAEPPATSRPPRRQAGSPPAVPPGAAQGTPS
jgi:hypothetical protein